jgi:hypothetical protein
MSRDTGDKRGDVADFSRLHHRALNAVLIAGVGGVALLGLAAIPKVQVHVAPFFATEARLSVLRNLLITVGGGLLGATAIGFSIVIFALQLNICADALRAIPHPQFGSKALKRALRHIPIGARRRRPISFSQSVMGRKCSRLRDHCSAGDFLFVHLLLSPGVDANKPIGAAQFARRARPPRYASIGSKSKVVSAFVPEAA